MIALHRPVTPAAPVIKIIGLGGAGGSALDRLVLDGVDGGALIAVNTDVQALNGSVAPQKIHIGKSATRGLGAGGDPELGYQAADEDSDELKAVIEGTDILFLCTGLGGGTGSGAAPLIAHLARGAGALVIAFATMPFSFEGKRRRKQAAEALGQLEDQADLVMCFENDRLGETAAPTAGVQEAFIAADRTLGQSIQSIAAIVRRGGIIPTSLDQLVSACRRKHPRCLFGHGESDSANRAHEALSRAMKCPLMDKGRMFADCTSVVVHVAGGTDVTVQEVTSLMDEFSKHVGEDTRIDFGLATDAKLGRRLHVTIISFTGAEEAAAAGAAALPAMQPAVRVAPRKAPVAPEPRALPVSEPAPAATFADEAETEDDIHEAMEPELSPETPVRTTQSYRKPSPEKAAAAKKEEKAEQMTLEPGKPRTF